MLNKHKIFAADDMRYTEVDMTAEWGDKLRIKTMSIEEQLQYEKIKETENAGDIVLQMVLVCCVDQDGKRLFENDDVKELQKKSTAAVFKVFNACIELNSLPKDDLEQKAKN
jgi:hypothetical protein